MEPVTHRDHKSDKNESELEKQDVVLSDFEEDAPRDLNLEGGDDFEPLRHSHFVNVFFIDNLAFKEEKTFPLTKEDQRAGELTAVDIRGEQTPERQER